MPGITLANQHDGTLLLSGAAVVDQGNGVALVVYPGQVADQGDGTASLTGVTLYLTVGISAQALGGDAA